MPPVARTLMDGPPDALPRRIADAACAATGVPCGLYVLDLDGYLLTRAAGDAELPSEIALPRRLGSAAFERCEPELADAVAAALPGGLVHPLWLRGHATAMLVSVGGDAAALTDLRAEAVLAMMVANRYTDAIQVARHRQATTPAAELQHDLLPPPIAELEGAELAAGILPAYTVGGDWYDWAQNADDLRLSIGDGVGRAETAMACAAVALSANRAARRRGDSLEDAARAVNDAVRALAGEDTLFVTAVLARWDPASATLTWLRCGHPVPVLLDASGEPREVPGAGTLPLGTLGDNARFVAEQAHLGPGERLILYSDGISEARRPDGSFFGVEGLLAAAREATSAATTVRAVLDAVEAEVESIEDDATMVVLQPTG